MGEAPRPLSRAEVREYDRLAMAELKIPGPVLMENAGRRAAEVVSELLEGRDAPVAILCGAGNNGGDGYVVARHLANEGHRVELYSTVSRPSLRGDALLNREVCDRMGLETTEIVTTHQLDREKGRWERAGVLVDGLLGTGFQGDVRPHLASVLRAASGLPRWPEGPRIVALDVPSGLDCDTGVPSNATLRADVTVTFVAPKPGFPAASHWTGRVVVAGIGAPPDLLERFAGSDGVTGGSDGVTMGSD